MLPGHEHSYCSFLYCASSEQNVEIYTKKWEGLFCSRDIKLAVGYMGVKHGRSHWGGKVGWGFFRQYVAEEDIWA